MLARQRQAKHISFLLQCTKLQRPGHTSAETLPQADGETPADRLLQAVRRGEIFKLGCDRHTTPQMGIKRLRQHCPARHINADPITVQRNLKPPFRAEFRVGAPADIGQQAGSTPDPPPFRSEEHTSELQSLMRISYAVFCLKK